MPMTMPNAWSGATLAPRACSTGTASARTSIAGAPVPWMPRTAQVEARACTSARGRYASRAPSPAMCWKYASLMWCRALGQPAVQGPDLRQQCGGELGLSLWRHAHRAPKARGGHHLRGGCDRRAQLGPRRLQLPLDAADRPLRRGPPDHRLSGRARGPPHDQQERKRAAQYPRSRAPAFRHHRRGAGRGGDGQLHSAQPHGRQHRQLAHRQGGDHVFPRGRARGNFTVGDPHASQGTPSCAARPSSAR